PDEALEPEIRDQLRVARSESDDSTHWLTTGGADYADRANPTIIGAHRIQIHSSGIGTDGAPERCRLRAGDESHLRLAQRVAHEDQNLGAGVVAKRVSQKAVDRC